jgi:hypothetical protein
VKLPPLLATPLLGSVELHAIAPFNVALSALIYGLGEEAASDLGNWKRLHSQVICLFVAASLACPQAYGVRQHQ